jgi:CDP-diacylglycerol--glycerol-3-phosphate 3-phosphatidyltransferase
MNLPNFLTLIRIFLVPVLVVVLLTRTGGYLLGPAIFGAAVITDWLDGYLARRRNQITRLGILLDPLADKLLVAAAFLSLVEMGAVQAWIVMIILAREFAVTGLRSIASGRGILIAASPLGKAKMVAEVVAIFALFFARRFPALETTAQVLLWVSVVVAFVSGADYFASYWRESTRPSKTIRAA